LSKGQKDGGKDMRPKALVIGGAVLLLVIFGALFLPRLSYVDPKPAIAFGDEYFSKLKQREVDEELGMYTDGFREKRGKEWQKLLADLDAQNGGVTDFKTVGSNIARVQFRDSSEIACVVVHYQVTRNRLASEEKVTICPNQRGAEWAITGHELTRLDTGQQFAAGLTIQEKMMFSTR
jgi:hypothetical protein